MMRLYGAFPHRRCSLLPTKHSQPALAALRHRAGTEHPIPSPIPVLKHGRLPVLMMVWPRGLPVERTSSASWCSPYQPQALVQESDNHTIIIKVLFRASVRNEWVPYPSCISIPSPSMYDLITMLHRGTSSSAS